MPDRIALPPAVADAFGVSPEAARLVGGEDRTCVSDNIVLRQENPGDEIEAAYTAELFSNMVEDGFRIARPVRTHGGDWLAPGRWSAWTLVEGRTSTRDDAPEMVRAIEAFHEAIAGAPYPTHIEARTSPYWWADQGAWGNIPPDVHRELAPIVERLSTLRRPVETSPEQVIHGDPNQDNILIASGLPPAIIDMATYWRPPEFALAVTAFWLAAYRGDPEVLVHFEHVPEFDQMLLRACIRSLLVMDGFGYRQELRVRCRYRDRGTPGSRVKQSRDGVAIVAVRAL